MDSVQGTYAKVKYGQHVETGEPVAIKVLVFCLRLFPPSFISTEYDALP